MRFALPDINLSTTNCFPILFSNTCVYSIYDVLFLFRADKEALESNLFEVQNALATLEAKKEQLEEINQNALLKNEALQGNFRFQVIWTG